MTEDVEKAVWDPRYNRKGFCITWDMDKIVYTCGAAYLGYEFPKRKWWDFEKKERFVEFILDDIFEKEKSGKNESFFRDEGISMRVRIAEYDTGAYQIWVDERRREDIWRAFLEQILQKKHYEALFVIDGDGEHFADILPYFAEDKNYLAVLTDYPEKYEGVMERIALEFGLIGMVFSDYRDFTWYQRQVGVKRQALVFWGNSPKKQMQKERMVFYRFQEDDFLIDCSIGQEYQSLIRGKRMEADYMSLPVFLDNMVKNRYNSLVNEGLQQKGQSSQWQQNVYRSDNKNKLSEKRKGIRKWKKRKIF